MDFKLRNIEPTGATGIDSFLARESESDSLEGLRLASSSRAPGVQKVSSLQQLSGFRRISEGTLVHKSTQDLWAIRREGEDFMIERLFQDNGSPLKG